MHHKQLLSDKNLPEMGFGQALIWLNYRYYIAIMLVFYLIRRSRCGILSFVDDGY